MLKRALVFVMLTLLVAAPGWADRRGYEPQPLSEVWVHTSGEYEALCHQTYNLAAERLRSLEPLLTRDKQGRAHLFHDPKPLAVVMDLDETVLDNSAFQVFLFTNRVPYKDHLWQSWVEYQGATARAHHSVPGALKFIQYVESLGITPIFITNRFESNRSHTTNVLKGLGVNLKDIDQRLFHRATNEHELAQEWVKEHGIDPTSRLGEALLSGHHSKERRRQIVQQKYQVAAFFGDVLSDFVATVKKDPNRTPAERKELAARMGPHWGRSFFVLPNPLYGPWAPGRAFPPKQAKRHVDDYGFGLWLRGQR